MTGLQNNKGRMDEIVKALCLGATVLIQTNTHAVKITPKTFEQWEERGSKLFREASDGSFYLASGKNWVCIDYATIRFYR